MSQTAYEKPKNLEGIKKRVLGNKNIKGRKTIHVIGDRAMGGMLLGKDKRVRHRQRERLGKAAMLDNIVNRIVSGEMAAKHMRDAKLTKKEKELVENAALDLRFKNPRGIETINMLRERMLKKAESVLEKMLDVEASPDKEHYPQLLKIKQDTAKYVTSSLAKEIYKSEEKRGDTNTFNKITINFIKSGEEEKQDIIRVNNDTE